VRNGCYYSNNRDAVAVINELIGRLNEFGEQCNAAQARGGGTHLDETKFQVVFLLFLTVLWLLFRRNYDDGRLLRYVLVCCPRNTSRERGYV